MNTIKHGISMTDNIIIFTPKKHKSNAIYSNSNFKKSMANTCENETIISLSCNSQSEFQGCLGKTMPLRGSVFPPHVPSKQLIDDLHIRISNNNMNSTGKCPKTKKNKKRITNEEKSQLWNIFEHDQKTMNTQDSIECVYENPCSISDYSTKLLIPKKELDLCNLCNSTLMIMDDGFPTCTNSTCGVIYKDTLDYSPEWRFYGAEDKNASDPTRCGNPINPLLLESSYGCKILCTTRSSYEMKKIRKWTEWQSMPHKEKSLYEEFQFITIMAQNAGISKIFIDEAMIIHKDISEQKMFRGLNRDGIKAASIYISCRLNGCPRTAHEISEIFKLDKTSATNGCSTAVNILNNIERSIDPSQQINLKTTTPSSFIERYCSKLNVNHELTMLAKFIANKIELHDLIMDNTPHAVAAGIVFFISQVCNLNISKFEIKHISGVSEVTINKCFKKLDDKRDIFIPKCILEKYK